MYRVAALASERGKADNENANLLQRWRRQPKAHALGITRLIVVPQEHFVVSLSFDASVGLLSDASASKGTFYQQVNARGDE